MNKKRISPIEKIVFDTEIDLKPQKKQSIRKHTDLQKLFEKKIIDGNQLYAGERLALDYENSFHYNSSTSLLLSEKNNNKNKSKSKITIDKSLIQNIYSYDSYHKAIMSIDNVITRDIVIKFCIDNIPLTKLDKQLGNKYGAAEIRLWYGLKQLVEFYRGRREEFKD